MLEHICNQFPEKKGPEHLTKNHAPSPDDALHLQNLPHVTIQSPKKSFVPTKSNGDPQEIQAHQALQSFATLRHEFLFSSDADLTLQRLDNWQLRLVESEALLKDFPPLLDHMREDFVNLAKQLEIKRLTFSRKMYHERYYKEIHALIKNDRAIERFHPSDATRFIRTEVKSIQAAYRQSEMYRKDLDGADNEYPDREGAEAQFIHACYKNYYDPQQGHFYATEAWKDRDQAKMSGEPLPNSELLINQALDVVDGDYKRLKIKSITRCIVSNKKSLAVVKALVQPDQTQCFAARSQEGSDLLKTPNCRAAFYMLEQYRWILDNQQVDQLIVTRYVDYDYGYGDVADITVKFGPRPETNKRIISS